MALPLQVAVRTVPSWRSSGIPLSASIDVLPVRGGERLLADFFEPLGYTVEASRHPLDEEFPEWGDGPHYSLTLSATERLSELLAHLYVLIPVFDNHKHYFVGDAELEKLTNHASGWLASHPRKEEITRRYLKFRPSLYRQALARLVHEEDDSVTDQSVTQNLPEASLEQPLSLNEQRLEAVVAALLESGARRVLDLGCGEGRLIKRLLEERQIAEVVGLDVSIRSLEYAGERLRLDRLSATTARRVRLLHGSLTYRDRRLEGFDAAALVEVIEHLDPPRLQALERTVFEFARPKTVVLTTPNREYNVVWENVGPQKLRHSDHRFEWTRGEFSTWAHGVAAARGYAVRFLPVGPVDEKLGSPTQMAIFERSD